MSMWGYDFNVQFNKNKSCGLWYIAIVLVAQRQIAITSLYLALSQTVLDENGLQNIRQSKLHIQEVSSV